MNIRKTILVAGLSALMIPAAFATSGAVFATGGEDSLRFHAAKSIKSRADVRAEVLDANTEGFGLMGGESGAGQATQRHGYGFQGGKLVHTDTFAHNSPKPSTTLTAADRMMYPGR